MSLPDFPTSAEIQALRQEHGLGIVEARRIAEGQWLHQAVMDARSVEDLRQVVRKLVDFTVPWSSLR